jgi:hypothetical protein
MSAKSNLGKQFPEPAMHHATMQGGRYTFDGFGATEEEAKAVVARGFRKHMKQAGVSMEEWRRDTGMPGSTDADIHEFFGTNVKPVYPGTAYRDDSPL